jgi:hypothetical protein
LELNGSEEFWNKKDCGRGHMDGVIRDPEVKDQRIGRKRTKRIANVAAYTSLLLPILGKRLTSANAPGENHQKVGMAMFRN